MRSRNNHNRLRLEELEHRCTPGSVLDLLGAPLLAPVDQSPVFMEATEIPAALGTANLSHTTSSQEKAANVDSAFSADAQAVRVQWSESTVIDGALQATRALISPQDNTILASPVTAQTQVPFKGSFEGDVMVTPLAPPLVSVLVVATGNSTQLGLFTLDIPHVVNRVTRTATGSYEFTAANGDTLSADFAGTATPTATPGVLYIEETATITGGTGRFAGATGSFTAERLFDMVARTTSGSFSGTISAPGP